MNSFGRLMDQILGHDVYKKHFMKCVASSELHHCNLMVGQEGIGKKMIAFAIAQELLCDEKKEDKACGFCPHCIRVAKNAHESVLYIEPESQSIKMESARQIQKFLQLSRIGKARIIIIDHVDKMNPQTANALLKTLEEPPEETYFFLITNNPHALLPTIQSRSQAVRIKPIPLDFLRKKSIADDWQIQASGGSFAELKKWQQEDKLARRNDFLHWLDSLKEINFVQLKEDCQGMAKDKEVFKESLFFLQLALRDALSLRLGSERPKYFPDHIEKIQKLAKIEQVELQKLYELCFNIEQDMTVNIDRALHLESFVFQIKRLLNRNQ